MARDESELRSQQVPPEPFARLAQALPQERAEIVLRLIEEHPTMLDLSSDDGAGANLRDIDLCRTTLKARLTQQGLTSAPWWNPYFEGANLQFAQLAGARLDSANLQGASLAGANLQDVQLTEANLQHAQLMGANLQHADLASAMLQGAHLDAANLQHARLTHADLRGAVLRNADLQHASLASAKLQGVDLSSCDLAEIYVGDVWLDRTKLSHKQLGERIGEEQAAEDRRKPAQERARLYEQAKAGYLALKQNFDDPGDYEAASWSYRKERRMRKLQALQEARVALEHRQWRNAFGHYGKYLADQCLAEWLCDYGESVRSVVRAILAFFIACTLFYGLTGSVIRIRDGTIICQLLRRDAACDWWSLVHFSLGAMSTMGVSGLGARYPWVDVVLRLQAVLSISLFGLLGFVAGNRIRRS